MVGDPHGYFLLHRDVSPDEELVKLTGEGQGSLICYWASSRCYGMLVSARGCMGRDAGVVGAHEE